MAMVNSALDFGICTSHSWPPIQACSLLLPQLERRYGEFIWIKKIIPCKCHLPTATIDNKKRFKWRPTKTNMHICFNSCIQLWGFVPFASKLGGNFLVFNGWCTLYNAISHWQKEVDVIIKDGIFHFGSWI